MKNTRQNIVNALTTVLDAQSQGCTTEEVISAVNVFHQVVLHNCHRKMADLLPGLDLGEYMDAAIQDFAKSAKTQTMAIKTRGLV